MKLLTQELTYLVIGTIIVVFAVHFSTLSANKMRADVRAANAQERIAAALEARLEAKKERQELKDAVASPRPVATRWLPLPGYNH